VEEYLEWFARFAERCQITLLTLKDGKDPTDEGWDILEEVHKKIFFDGSLTFYKTIMEGEQTKATQGGLFN